MAKAICNYVSGSLIKWAAMLETEPADDSARVAPLCFNFISIKYTSAQKFTWYTAAEKRQSPEWSKVCILAEVLGLLCRKLVECLIHQNGSLQEILQVLHKFSTKI